MMTSDTIKQLIAESLQTSYLEVKGDDGTHFEAVIVSPEFEGLTMVKQHQLVYAALGRRIDTGEIHALGLKTYTPAEWQAMSA